MNRILVIRGGAIGDFILSLPALKALRDVHPAAHIEILGYKHIAALAENRFYAQAVRSIEYGPLSGFFAKNSKLSTELMNYFSSFDLIISYLYDPDEIFERNIQVCGVQNLISGPAKIDNSAHAARQLAQPVEALGIKVVDLAAKIFPSAEDQNSRAIFFAICRGRFLQFIPAAVAKRKIGQSKAGSISETICSAVKVFVDQCWSFRVKPIALKSRDWKRSGKISV